MTAEIVIAEWLEAARELGRPVPEPKGRLLFAQIDCIHFIPPLPDGVIR